MQKYRVVFLLYLVASTLAFNCPEGPDFVNCQNAESHRIHKREAEYIHSIHVERAKEKLMEAYQEIRPFLDDLVADVAPTIHEKFSQTYMPALRSFRDEVMPFFNAKVYPQIQKYYKFALNVADKLIGKTYRAYKLSNSTHLAVISISDLIDETFNEFKPILDMARYLSARMMASDGHYRGKRHVSENSGNIVDGNFEEVHIIDIQKLKAKLIEAYQEFKPLLENLASEISPSIYEEFALSYIPKLQEIVNIVSPFLNSKVYSQVEKYVKFASSIAEKLVDRLYSSYQLSNSSHINIVSISDIIEDVYTESKPILDLGKYLSMRMSMSGKHYRGRRDVSEASKDTLLRHKREEMSDLLMSVAGPFVENMVHSMTTTFLGGSDSLLSKVVLPLIYDILRDPESRYDLYTSFLIGKSAFAPLIWEMMRNQAYNTPEGTVIRIPRHMFEKAMSDWQIARPPVERLVKKYTRNFFKYMEEATPQVVDLLDYMLYEGYSGVDILKDQYFAFMNKHRGLFRSSSATHVHYYPLNEILNDLKPIKVSAMNLIIQYARRNPDSWVNIFFGEDSLSMKLYVGMPTYAKPIKFAKPANVAPVNTRVSYKYRYDSRG